MISVFYRPCGKSPNEQHTAAYELLDAASVFLGYGKQDVVKTKEGKPYFRRCPTCFFSIAHAEGMAVVVIGDAVCGIDVENEARTLSPRLVKRFLGEAEGEEPLLLWTKRESYGKMEGSGFFAPVDAYAKTDYHTFSLENGQGERYLVTVACPKGTHVDLPPRRF